VSRIAHFDCASGASGDMILGALVDLGLPLARLDQALESLKLPGVRLEARHVMRSGLQATKVDVIETAGHQTHHGHHAHRGLREIERLLEASALGAPVKERCQKLFLRLAEAEGVVHGVSPEAVHFHEVGAIDSIVDIVGGVFGLLELGAERFSATPLNLGAGNVTMSHGTFPVPPPATALLVKGVPVYGDGDGELLTPTGALLLTGFVSHYGPMPLLRAEAVGHGAGTRETPGRPNVLRLTVGDEESRGHAERVLLLETEVDDTTGQFLGMLLEHLLAAGALDAFLTPILMKKGRPGTLISVLSATEKRGAIEEMLFRETTTLGVRCQEWERTTLERTLVPVNTAFGEIRVKIGRRGGMVYNAQPEFEDCRRAADGTGASVKDVWAAALAAFERLPR
jgi:uncharacterized protein (TIGR00299 family) protein